MLKIRSVECPPHCRIIELRRHQFEVSPSNGSLAVVGPSSSSSSPSSPSSSLSSVSVPDYCVAYYCTNDVPRHWHIKAEACLCHGEEALEAAAAATPEASQIRRCCPDTLQLERPGGGRSGAKDVTCPISEYRNEGSEPRPELRSCAQPGEWLVVEEQHLNISRESRNARVEEEEVDEDRDDGKIVELHVQV